MRTKEVTESVKEIKRELEVELVASENRIQELERELAEAKARAEKREKEIEEMNKLISKAEQEQFSKVPVYEKTLDFLRAKSVFLNSRRETIEELKKYFIALENKFDEHAVIGEIGSAIGNVGGLIPDAITFGVPKIVEETIKLSNNFFKANLISKGSKEFQISLENEKELAQLNDAYNALIDLINENGGLESDSDLLSLKDRSRVGETRPFNIDHRIYNVLKNDGIWKYRKLTSEKMETTIKSLDKNFEELEAEWNEQFEKLKSNLDGKYVKLFMREQQVRAAIQQTQRELEESINSTRRQLKSSSKFSEDKRQEREEKLESLFKNFPATQKEFVDILENAKEGLSKKLTEAEISKLYQIQNELTRLQKELESLQSQQQSIPIFQVGKPTELLAQLTVESQTDLTIADIRNLEKQIKDLESRPDINQTRRETVKNERDTYRTQYESEQQTYGKTKIDLTTVQQERDARPDITNEKWAEKIQQNLQEHIKQIQLLEAAKVSREQELEQERKEIEELYQQIRDNYEQSLKEEKQSRQKAEEEKTYLKSVIEDHKEQIESAVEKADNNAERVTELEAQIQQAEQAKTRSRLLPRLPWKRN